MLAEHLNTYAWKLSDDLGTQKSNILNHFVNYRRKSIFIYFIRSLEKKEEINIMLYNHLQHHNDTIIKQDKDVVTRCKKTSLTIFLPLTLLQGFERVVQGLACERVLETEHKLHILTPLLWPSRCVFIVLLMLGSTPSGLSEGPLGLVWPSLPHLVSNPLGVWWQLPWHPKLNWVK